MTLIFELIGTIGTIASIISLAIMLCDRRMNKKRNEPSAATDGSKGA